jgi:hypothetical protein
LFCFYLYINISFIIYHLSFIIYHLSYIIYHISHITYHISHVICHMSYIIYHISYIIYHISYLPFAQDSRILSLSSWDVSTRWASSEAKRRTNCNDQSRGETLLWKWMVYAMENPSINVWFRVYPPFQETSILWETWGGTLNKCWFPTL